ncbi:MAG: phospholipase D-like domain-containing protein [Chitinophagaceae bacterium]
MSSGKQYSTPGYAQASNVRLVRAGTEYFDCAHSMIRNARSVIHLQTYIYEEDHTGQVIAQALADAVKRGVSVYLLVDGYASRTLSKSFLRQLDMDGINFRFFAPLFRNTNFYVGRRLHHKILVADVDEALVGGVNISDRYNDLPGQPAWLDFALYTKGAIVSELYTLCCKTWNNFRNGATFPVLKPQQSTAPPDNLSTIALCRNDWVRRKNQVSSTYVRMLRSATSEVIILSSYFIPGKMIRSQLAQAARRGVKIKIITAGNSDVGIAKYAERYSYSFLLRNHIELYEYKGNILHGKLAVCDDRWLTIGSYNLNNISAYASIELNLNVQDEKIARKSAQVLRELIDQHCVRVSDSISGHVRNPFSRLLQWVSHHTVRFIFYVFTFYYKHHA